jgi:hypothetical protein
MRKLTIITGLCLVLTGFTLSHAEELVKGINYLGTENGVKSYHIVCSNGKEGDVYVDTETKEVKIKKDDGFVQDLGQIRFGDAVKEVCR